MGAAPIEKIALFDPHLELPTLSTVDFPDNPKLGKTGAVGENWCRTDSRAPCSRTDKIGGKTAHIWGERPYRNKKDGASACVFSVA